MAINERGCMLGLEGRRGIALWKGNRGASRQNCRGRMEE